VFGIADAGCDRLADSVCTGLQLLNHLQDLGDDLRARDRIYFPIEDLARFGVTEEALRQDQANAPVRALVQHWHARVTALLRQGWPIVAAVPGRLRLELRAIIWGASLCLRRIAAAQFDVLATKAHLSRTAKMSLPLRALLAAPPPELR
jgi:phytoene/squalene synthetase